MSQICKLRISKTRFFAPSYGFSAVTLLTLALLLSLGFWQLHRLAWKESLISRATASLAAAPQPLSPALASSIAANINKLDFTHVQVTGEFLNDDEIYLGGRPHPGIVGYDVLTPLRLVDGGLVLVNRGWVPYARLDPSTRSGGQVSGPVTITGVIRKPAEPTWLTPPPDPAHRLFYVYDMAGFVYLLRGKMLPFIIEADANTTVPGGPEAGVTSINFPNNHMEYAVTWFSLALALVVIWGVYSIKDETTIAEEDAEDDRDA